MVTYVACGGVIRSVHAVRVSHCGALRAHVVAARILRNRPTYIVSGCVAVVVSSSR